MSDCPGCAEWREKHYPVEAKDCPAERALDHSIAKWEGVARLLEGPIGEVSIICKGFAFCAQCGDGWNIDDSTCALCAAHPRCDTCPIVTATGAPCFTAYDSFLNDRTAAPMLDLLRRVEEAGQ